MRQISCIVFGGLLAFTPTTTFSADLKPETVGNEGIITIYRGGTMVGLASACPVRHEGKEVVELGRGKYTEWRVPSGRYILTNKTSSVEVAVAPGETRFVRCNMKMGILTYRADLQIADRADFETARPDLELKSLR